MTGIVDLKVLLKNMHPQLSDEEFVYCSLNNQTDSQIMQLDPLCIYREAEGTTIVITKQQAIAKGISFDLVLKKITLEVHSSLSAIGLTAAVATALTKKHISCNVIAAYYHDHIFVPSSEAGLALETLVILTEE